MLRPRVSWYRRLSVRYGILVALTIIAFIKVQPHVMQAVSGWFGIRVHDPFVVAPDEVEFVDVPKDDNCSIPPAVIQAVLQAGEPAAPEQRAASLQIALQDWECAMTPGYVVAGADLVVIQSNIEGLAPGSTMTPEQEFRSTYFPVKSEFGALRWLCFVPPAMGSSNGGFVIPPPPAVSVGMGAAMVGMSPDEPSVISMTVSTEVEPIGTLPNAGSGYSQIFTEEAVPEDLPVYDYELGAWTVNGYELDSSVMKKGGTLPDGTPVLTSAEVKRQEANYRIIGIIVSWALPISAALLLGMLVSWMITRRIVRLSEAASDPAIDSFELLGLRGNDEIARLGEALSDSRGRAAGLVRELAERDAQRREWFAQVSHDLRTPLTALSACLERAVPMVQGVPPGPGRENLVRTIEVARQDTERVHRLATDLLDVARLELPNALNLEETLPAEVAERVVLLLSPIAEREGISLLLREPRFSESAEVTPVEADPSRLLRVLENLVRNGIQYAVSEVTVSVEHVRGGVRLTVADDGPGFSESETSIRATQADPRGTARADSAGLGLVVVMRALEAHGTALELSNRTRGGAMASFVLPASQASLEPGFEDSHAAVGV